MRTPLCVLIVVFATSLTTQSTSATAVVVTFYNDQASFLAAVSNPTVDDFEGIATDTGFVNFGASYHTGSVAFTSPRNTSPVSYRNMLVVGKNSQTLGAPFDSAILIPASEPSSIVATFDAGTNVTAAGGFFLNLFGNSQEIATLKLFGSTGLLDVRDAPLGIATTGKPKTFLGYTVVGDVISSLSVNIGTNAPAFDSFTYGPVVPEPSSCVLLIGTLGVALTRRGGRRKSDIDDIISLFGASKEKKKKHVTAIHKLRLVDPSRLLTPHSAQTHSC